MRQHTVATPYMVGESHFYTTELSGELVLFDTGPATEQALDYLRTNVDLERLRHVFVTHCHVDHYGLTDFLARNTKAEIYLPRKDALKIRHHRERLEAISALLQDFGFHEEFVGAVRVTAMGNGIFPPFPERFRIVEEDEAPQRLGIDWYACPGHSQSDLVYRVGNWAVTGDTLLRDIFQAPLLDIELDTFSGRFRNYEAYCASLEQLWLLRDCLICPGHRYTTDGVEATLLGYVGKLLERAARIRDLGGMPANELLACLFDEMPSDLFVCYIKLSEIIFLRDFLAAPYKLKEVLERIGLFTAVENRYHELSLTSALEGDSR